MTEENKTKSCIT